MYLNDMIKKGNNFYTAQPAAANDNENESEASPDDNDGFIAVREDGHFYYCMTIIGQVEGHYILASNNKTTKYEHVIPRLVAIEEDKRVDGLLLILNTVGGDIEAGLAIAELIAGMKTPTVSLVLGGGHSIGVPLAVAADKSFIVKSATMTIHPVRMNGLVLGVVQTMKYFENMQERIVNFVSANSKISAVRFRELMLNSGELVMDFGTVLSGERAVEEGIIDSIGGLSDALSALDSLRSPESMA